MGCDCPECTRYREIVEKKSLNNDVVHGPLFFSESEIQVACNSVWYNVLSSDYDETNQTEVFQTEGPRIAREKSAINCQNCLNNPFLRTS